MKTESTGGFYTQIRNDDGLRLFKDGTEISAETDGPRECDRPSDSVYII